MHLEPSGSTYGSRSAAPDPYLKEDHDVVKLLEQEEARCHALTAGDGVTLGGRGAHHLEVLLGGLEMLLKKGRG